MVMAVKPKLKLTEADVTRQVCDFMGYEGWRGVRNNVGVATNLATGQQVAFNERGMPDWLFIRYWNDPGMVSEGDFIWIEMKAPGKKPTAHQKAWHEAERLRGALVKVVDHFETFRDWYRECF